MFQRLLVVAALLLSTLSHAHGFHLLSPKEQLKELNVPLGAAVALPIGYAQMVTHEVSHGVFATALGADSVTYVLYPQTDTGQFSWAYTRMHWPNEDPRTFYITSASAQIWDAVVIGSIFLVDNLVKLPKWLHTVLKVWQISAFVDFMYNMSGLWQPGTTLYPENDFRNVYYGLLRMQPSAAIPLTGTMAAILAVPVFAY